MSVKLWEILVPGSWGRTRYSYEHHKEWDAYVRGKTNGLTILRGAKGEWLNDSGVLHVDKVIPVRIACTKEVIDDIMSFTIEHYDQEAVFAYEVSSTVLIKHRDEDGQT